MNAVIDSVRDDHASSAPPVRAPHRTQRFRTLLRRELWEHKGGFFWAPMIAGGVFLLLALMGIGIGEVTRQKFAGNAVDIEGRSGLTIGMLDLSDVTGQLDAKDLVELGKAVDITLLMAVTWPMIVLAFVVFFYCLGALYDERKDRSVLFWKSLPVSDRDTVLSKVVGATVLAPVIATVAGLLTMLGLLVICSLAILAYGGNPVTLLWAPGHPFRMAMQLVASIPVFAVWALPTVGWLMLCSAWARSKPFLWAIMIPVFAGIFVTWFRLMNLFDQGAGWFWQHVVARMLLSTVPGSDLFYRGPNSGITDDSFERIDQLLSLSNTYAAFLRPEMWIGAAAGIAMLLVAVRLRRWRDEG